MTKLTVKFIKSLIILIKFKGLDSAFLYKYDELKK